MSCAPFLQANASMLESSVCSVGANRASPDSRRSQGVMAPKISSTSCHFVLREPVSQTKYCYSLKFKRFAPPQILSWLRRHCARFLLPSSASRVHDIESCATCVLTMVRWKQARKPIVFVLYFFCLCCNRAKKGRSDVSRFYVYWRCFIKTCVENFLGQGVLVKWAKV